MKHIILITLILISFTACKQNNVSVVSRNFDKEIEQQQNLSFTFDKDMVNDSLLNIWQDTIKYIKFDPEVPGRFKWTAKNELTFSPFYAFAPSTDYECTIQPAIATYSSRKWKVAKNSKFSFHTPYLKLMSATGFWTMSTKMADKAALMITMGFNYSVDPIAVKTLTQLKVSDLAANYEMISSAVDKNINVIIDGLDRHNLKNYPVSVYIAKGLKCAESSYVTKEPMTMAAIVPAADKMEITNMTGEYSGEETAIHVYTSQAVEETGLKELITIEPKVQFQTQVADNGFFIKGTFALGQNYTVTISKDIQGQLGGKMANDYRGQVSFGKLEPMIAFMNNKGLYLSSKGSKNVGLNIVNVLKVHVAVYKIFENNIQHYLREGRYNDYYYSEEDDESYEGGYNYNTYSMKYYGSPILNQEYDTKDLPKKNGISLLNLSFDNKEDFKGVYLVNVSSMENSWVRSTKLVSVSDIGLIVKKSDDEMYVFANSLKTSEALKGVKISLISENNQNVVTASTNNDGVAVISNLRNKLSDFNLTMLTARDGEDFNYLMLKDARVNSSRFDVGGRRANPTGINAFLYGDRDIYRPGETIYLNTIVRDEMWQPQAALPVKLKLLMPNGKEYKLVRGTLNNQGAFVTSIPLTTTAMTGIYVAEVFTANDVLIQSKNISVEEFMPDRIDVKVKMDKENLEAEQSMAINITALNMFGPPAADRKYEIQYDVTRKLFSSKDFRNYSFHIKSDEKAPFHETSVTEGKTDANGNAVNMFEAKDDWNDQGVLSTKVFTTVFDETGRPVNRVNSFDIFTQKVFYGVKMTDRYVDRGVAVTFPLIALNKAGKAITSKAEVQIVRYDWYSSLENNNYGSYRWISKTKEVILQDQTITLPATGYNFLFMPRESGEYEIRVKHPESNNFTAEKFYSYGWGYTSNTSFEVNTEGQVDVHFDKEVYQPGEDAALVFSCPFNGKLLVTIEGDKVLEYRYLNTDKKTAMLKLPVKEAYLPNVYVTATLFRPVDDGSIPLTVGHGFSPLMVEKAATILPITIDAPERSRSKTKQTITVSAGGRKDVELTVAVVDEGILALKNYKTPDPHKFFYQKKALGVDAYDLYPILLPELKSSVSSTAGDAALEKRVNPLTNKRVKLVALWSGILHTDDNGKASYTFDIPQFSGDLRVMACAYQDKSFGSADKHIKVADPIVISPSIPRFLSPNDILEMPVTLTNTTAKQVSATAKLALTGPLTNAGEQSRTVSIKPNSEQRIHFKVAAANTMDVGSITINVNALNETFTDRTDITVRPSTSLLKTSGSGEITGNKSISMKHDFIPSTADANLLISANPMVQFSNSLQYLVGYPYGCIEQTTSKAFPQIYFVELTKNMKYANSTDMNPAANVQAAVNKIQSMQSYEGGMNMWPGDYNYISWWGTVYSAHFLIEAKKAGYDVNANVIDRALNFCAQNVKGYKTERYFYATDYRSGSWREKNIYAQDNFYSLYLLALNGRPDVSAMNYFKSDLTKVALDCRYMLACTYLAIGDRKSYTELLPKSFEGEYAANATGGSFYSHLRDMALATNVLLDVDPGNPQIPELIRHLSIQVNQNRYLNTQEAAFSFLALGKFMRTLGNSGSVTASINVDGKTVSKFNGKDVRLTKNIAGRSVNVSVNGNGKLFYFWQIEGLSATGSFKEEDKYLSVRKTYFDRFGREIDIHRVKQGDLIAVRLRLLNLEKSNVDNIVVTDMLPSGFEIENPRISENQDMTWIKDQTTPQYFDVRDDRINFFTSISSQAQNFYYLVRAVSTGEFKIGPVSADAMYNGEYHSYNGATTVKVVQ